MDQKYRSLTAELQGFVNSSTQSDKANNSALCNSSNRMTSSTNALSLLFQSCSAQASLNAPRRCLLVDHRGSRTAVKALIVIYAAASPF